MKQRRDVELISDAEWSFESCLTGAIKMKFKDISMQVKDIDIRRKKK